VTIGRLSVRYYPGYWLFSFVRHPWHGQRWLNVGPFAIGWGKWL